MPFYGQDWILLFLSFINDYFLMMPILLNKSVFCASSA